jgi:hypothetical protein
MNTKKPLVLSALFSAALAASAALPGCVGTSVGNPPGAEVKLAVVGTGGVEAASLNEAAIEVEGGIVIKEAWISLTEIGLHAAGTCGMGGESPDVPGPIAAELVTGSIYPEAPLWERPPDESYCAFRTRVSPLSDTISNIPLELLGHSALIRGERGDGTPFEARVDVMDLILITGSNGPDFRLGTGLVGLILAFDLGAWFDPGLMAAAQATNGTILISPESNKEIEKDMRQRIPTSSRLFTDANGDGRLNPGDGEL